MAARRLTWSGVLVAALLVGGGVARAQDPTVSAVPPPALLPGSVLELTLFIQDSQQFRTFFQADVTLPPHLLLRGVFATDAAAGTFTGDFITSGQLDDNPPGAGLGCTRSGNVFSGCGVDPAAGALAPYAVTLLDSGGQQMVRIDRNPAEFNWEQTIRLAVEVLGPYNCGPGSNVVATFRATAALDVSDTVCVEDLDVVGVQAAPSGVIGAQRASPTQVASWSWQVDAAGGPFAPPGGAQLALTCRPAAACVEGDPAQRLRLTTSSAGGQAEVLNAPPDPPPGPSAVAMDVVYAGVTYNDVVSITIDEQPPALFRVSAPGGLVYGTDQQITLNISAAENAQGGVEPRRAASWQVQAISPATLPPGVDPNTWLVSPALNTTGLLVPQSAVGFLAGQPMVLRVTAVPATAGGAAAESSLDLTINPAPAQQCSITAAATTATWGETIALQLHRQVGSQPVEDLPLDATWSVSGAGSVAVGAPGTGSATFVAPRRPGVSTVNASFGGSPLCDNASAQVSIETVGQVRLVLTSPRDVARAGEVLSFQAAAVSPQPALVPELQIALESPGMRLLSREASVLRAVSSAQTTTALPVLVRLGSSCGRQRAVLVARVDGQEVARSGEVALTVQCDPELNEATLFGKVFADANGDSEQQEGELGLPGVMLGVSTSVYAITDADGRYSIPALLPGRVAIKINANTLPVGAQVVGVETRAVTLTPGMFTRVNFPVQTLSLQDQGTLQFAAEGSGVQLTPEGLKYRVWFAGAPHLKVSARRGPHEVAGAWEDGRWRLDLPLSNEPATWSLVVIDPEGRAAVYAFGVHVYEREADRLVLPWGPRLLLRWGIPVDGEASVRSGLRLRAEMHAPGRAFATTSDQPAPGCALEVAEAELQGERVLECALPVTGDTAQLTVSFDASPDERGDDPPPLSVSLPLRPRTQEHFLVGLATYEMGCDPVPNGFDLRNCLGDGGGSFYYAGTFGDLQLSAGMALRARDPYRSLSRWETAEGVLDTLLGSDPTRVFRDLDPEQYYPTYGDGSTVVDERESGGRFFFRLQHGDDFLRWGGVRTGIGTGDDEVEVGRYQRALYGLGGRYTLSHTTEDGTDLGLSAKVFAAHPESASARDSFVVTGGSLYYLSHRPVVMGSVRATLEILDEVSGWVMRRVQLTEGIDFETDPYSGRLHLNPTLPYQFWGRSLTASGPGGNTGQLIVEYEYVPGFGSAGALAAGGRLLTRLGPLSLGGTYVTELGNAGQPTYHLAGATARWEMGKRLWGEVDYAYSWGGSHTMFSSDNGGLAGADLGVGRGEGHAVGGELGTEIGGVTARAYGRFYQAGFTDSRRAAVGEQWQVGVAASAKLPSDTGLWLQVDYQSLRPQPADPETGRATAMLGASQKLSWLELGLEGRFVQLTGASDNMAVLVGAQAGARINEGTLIYARRRQEVLSPYFGGTAVGATVDISGWSFGGELGMDDDLSFFGRVTGGMPVDAETQLYAGYLRASRVGLGLGLLAPEPAHRLITGGRRRTSSGTTLWAESTIEEAGPTPGSPGPYRSLQTVGGQVPLTKSLAVTLSYQRSALRSDDVTGSAPERNSGSLGVLWSGESLRVNVSSDVRLEGLGSASELMQVGAQGRIEWLVTRALTLALAGRGAASWGAATLTGSAAAGTRQRLAWEGSTGFAFRPIDSDWLNAFGRYAVVAEDGTAGPTSAVPLPVRQISHTGALNFIFEIFGPLALGTKVAYRFTEAEIPVQPGAQGPEPGDGPVQDDALVGALRGDLHLNGMWDVTAEGRVCGSPLGGGSVAGGALVELNALLMGWLRLGAGYNFSDIATGSVRCNEPGARGVFVRAEAMY